MSLSSGLHCHAHLQIPKPRKKKKFTFVHSPTENYILLFVPGIWYICIGCIAQL